MASGTFQTDSTLLSAIALGDEAAFTILFERYRDKLFYYLLKHVKSPEVAEEIVTDIFMKLWTGRALAEQIKDIGAFLHKVGYYKALDFLRITARHARLRQVYMDYMSLPGAPRADELVISTELKALLYRAINGLSPQRRMIYQLSRQEGLTHEQIAALLGLSPSTINNALVAANRSIEKSLRAYAGQTDILLLYFLF
ncbi:MAG: sigma-70 family RNA polymerase sigma factor [Sphingobacteriales bacterium]|nr:sigma-70 family RNA polymerase sigma factor [Sphingobacteriales bacterium]